MSKGGWTSGTRTSGSTWSSGKTQTIRVPIALVDEIMAYARALDSGIGLSQVNRADVILEAIDYYIKFRGKNFRPNQHSRKPDLTSRAWDELRKFQKLVKENPQVLGIEKDDTCRR
ncbi:hypothetical protein NIES4103_27510 [Nostoc sp. NIES-4103]|nr:hypothetical protein NIES4103_27510 [Nostoc sp. NIES-4103]